MTENSDSSEQSDTVFQISYTDVCIEEQIGSEALHLSWSWIQNTHLHCYLFILLSLMLSTTNQTLLNFANLAFLYPALVLHLIE